MICAAVAQRPSTVHGVRNLIGPVVVVLLVLEVGCGPSVQPRQRSESEENLHEIYRAYKSAEMQTQQPPKRLEEIKSFFPDGDPQPYLASPEDGEPYVIVWGTSSMLGPVNFVPEKGKPAPAPSTKTSVLIPILAYEKNGRDGKRHVLNSVGTVTVIGDAEFKTAPFAGGHKPK